MAAAEKLFADMRSTGIDRFLLLCTQTPDYPLPTTACLVQHRLGLPTSIGALDFNLGCSGFVYGLSLADGLIRTGAARRLLLITAETYSANTSLPTIVRCGRFSATGPRPRSSKPPTRNRCRPSFSAPTAAQATL